MKYKELPLAGFAGQRHCRLVLESICTTKWLERQTVSGKEGEGVHEAEVEEGWARSVMEGGCVQLEKRCI